MISPSPDAEGSARSALWLVLLTAMNLVLVAAAVAGYLLWISAPNHRGAPADSRRHPQAHGNLVASAGADPAALPPKSLSGADLTLTYYLVSSAQQGKREQEALAAVDGIRSEEGQPPVNATVVLASSALGQAVQLAAIWQPGDELQHDGEAPSITVIDLRSP